MGPPSHNSRLQRGAPSEGDTFSINQGDPLAPSPGPASLPLAMMPPMTSPMPPTGTYAGGAMTPATGGKAPATATGGLAAARRYARAKVIARAASSGKRVSSR